MTRGPADASPSEVARALPMRVLVVGHEATRTGASLQLLYTLQAWADRDDVELQVVLRRGGPLLSAFRALAPTAVLTPALVVSARQVVLRTGQRAARRAMPGAPRGSQPGPTPAATPAPGSRLRPGELVRIANIRLFEPPRRRLRQIARRAKPDVVLLNTGTMGDLLPALAPTPVVAYVHEQHATLRRTSYRRHVDRLLSQSTRILASSDAVREELLGVYGVVENRVTVVRPSLPTARAVNRASARAALASLCDVPSDVMVVGGCGALYWAKDPDMFVELAARVSEADSATRCRFVWLGGEARDPERDRLTAVLAQRGLTGTVSFLPSRPDPETFFAALDVFALVSRTESFGVVGLEAARAHVPVLCFETAGGMAEFVRDDAGFVVPGRDVDQMAAHVLRLADDPALRRRLGETGAGRVAEEHSSQRSAARILDVLEEAAGRRLD